MRQIGNIKSTYASDVALIAAKLQLEDDDCRSHAEEDGRSGSAADPQLSSQQAAWSRKAFICAHCDDGGVLLLCDGSCQRAFHCGMVLGQSCRKPLWRAEVCNPLHCPQGLYSQVSKHEEPFLCPSCLAGIQQCFSCRKEGTVKGSSPELFRCGAAGCGRHYHPECAGLSLADCRLGFECTLHRCAACKEGASEGRGEAIMCRRCPIAYHRGCLPDALVSGPERRVRISNKDLMRTNVIFSGVVECNLDGSLLFCMRHLMVDGSPLHKTALFRPDLLIAWVRHYAHKYADQTWAAALLRKAAQAPVRLADRERIQRNFATTALRTALDDLNRRLLPLLCNGDTVVDFAQGAGLWLPALKRLCQQEGLRINGRAFRSGVPVGSFHGNWFLEKRAGQLPAGDTLIVGLSAPAQLVDKFLRHATIFRPRLLILVLPAVKELPGYRPLCSDSVLMASASSIFSCAAPMVFISARQDYFPQAYDLVRAGSGVPQSLMHAARAEQLAGKKKKKEEQKEKKKQKTASAEAGVAVLRH